MNYRSPLSRAKGLGSSGDGVHHWRVQRISAVALIPLTLWFVFAVSELPGTGYAGFVDWLSQPWVPVLSVLFFGCAYYHAALGLQVVIEDYVHDELVCNVALVAVKLLLLLLAVSTIVSILAVAL